MCRAAPYAETVLVHMMLIVIFAELTYLFNSVTDFIPNAFISHLDTA